MGLPGNENDARPEMPIREGWTDRTVDENGEHFEIWYEASGMRTRVLVARVSPAVDGMLGVQFLLDHQNPPVSDAKREAIREIDFYVKTAKPAFWPYMRYHIGTSSNIYSDVHWVLKTAKY